MSLTGFNERKMKCWPNFAIRNAPEKKLQKKLVR